MIFIGIASLIAIYLSLLAFVLTERRAWLLPCLWCIPPLGMASFAPEGAQINGLVIVICLLMLVINYISIERVKIWNIKSRANTHIIFGIIYIITFILLFYCASQSQINGYIYNFQGFGKSGILRVLLTSIPLLLLNIPITNMVITFIDKFFSTSSKLVLLECKTFVVKEFGAEGRGIFKGRYLNGINNGMKYHFRMTLKTYYLLKKEQIVVLNLKRGCLGGLYVLKLPELEKGDKTRRLNIWLAKKAAIYTAIFIIIVFVIWLFIYIL